MSRLRCAVAQAPRYGDSVQVTRPGRIKCDLPVPIAHPRHYSVKTSPVFTELKARLMEEIRIEVQRAAALAAAHP